MEATVNVHGDPAECKCECHIPYDPYALEEVFISHWNAPCCGPALQGSRVEVLPDGRNLDDHNWTAEQVADIEYFQRNLRRCLGVPEPTLNENETE